MTVSASSSNFDRVINGASTSHSLALPTTCPAGATIIVLVNNRTDGTAATGCSDPTNGAYTLGSERGTGYNDMQAYYFLNNGSSGAHTITVTYGSSVTAQMAVGWISSDAGVLTFDGAATPAILSNGTDHNSNTFAASGAGAIVGLLTTNNAQSDPEPTADGTNETELLTGLSGLRLGVFFEPYASSGTYGIEATTDSATACFLVLAFLEPSGSAVAAITAYYNMLRNS